MYRFCVFSGAWSVLGKSLWDYFLENLEKQEPFYFSKYCMDSLRYHLGFRELGLPIWVKPKCSQTFFDESPAPMIIRRSVGPPFHRWCGSKRHWTSNCRLCNSRHEWQVNSRFQPLSGTLLSFGRRVVGDHEWPSAYATKWFR